MPKFIITWDIGYGEHADVVECANQDEAQMAAYERAREDFESSADYSAKPYTLEEALALSLEVAP